MSDGEANQLRDASTGDLFKRLSQQTSELVRKELDLAKAELTEKGKTAGKSAGMFGGAGLFGLTAFLALTACLIALLSTAMEVWLAALIVTVVYAAVAGVLALIGRRKLKEATPPAPEQTIETLKEDVQWAKNQRPSGAR
jgi:uncharacterized membrane protein YqjE